MLQGVEPTLSQSIEIWLLNVEEYAQFTNLATSKFRQVVVPTVVLVISRRHARLGSTAARL